MKRLTTLRVVLAVTSVAVVLAPLAAAGQPSIVTLSFSQSFVVSGVCAFPITVDSTMTEHDQFFSDANGTLTRALGHVDEQDTFTANGKSLTGDPYHPQIDVSFDSSGNVIQGYVDGVIERVPLPDGTVFQSTGRVNLAAEGFAPFVAIPTDGTAKNLAGFCAALSP